MRRLLTLSVLVGLLAAPGAAETTLRLSHADLQDPGTANPNQEVDWLSMDLEPATISPRFKGKIRFRNLLVVGDYEEIEWHAGPGAPVRTYSRSGTLFRDGLTLSVFDLEIPGGDFRAAAPSLVRFDCRTPPGCKDPTSWPFRIRPKTIPRTRVVRINDRVQYSSHVVNIVAEDNCYRGSACVSSIPAFLPLGDRYVDPFEVSGLFYTHFTDTYEQLVLVPERIHRSPQSGAAALAGYLDVQGTNAPNLDFRDLWGSSILRGAIALFRGGQLGNWLSVHETGHLWGWYLDLFAVAGVSPRGSSECIGTASGHAPLIAGQSTFLSLCLNLNANRDPNLRIVRSGNRWVLAAPEQPITYHPFQLYSMGLLAPEQVPPLWLPLNQELPRPTIAGTRVRGEFVEVTIDDVIAHYGERRGSRIESVFRRAYIIISPRRLLPEKDLAWFNFFARRMSDPDIMGLESFDGTPSMELATLGMVDLVTEIRPRSGAEVRADFEVSYPRVGKKDLRGLKFTRNLPTYFETGRIYVLEGRVEKTHGHDAIRIAVGAKEFVGEIGANRRFAVEIQLGEDDLGPQWLTVGLGEFDVVLGRIAPVYVR